MCDELEVEEEQAEAVFKEVGLVSRVASPQAMEALSADCSRLREAITHTKDLIRLKRDERETSLLRAIEGKIMFVSPPPLSLLFQAAPVVILL